MAQYASQTSVSADEYQETVEPGIIPELPGLPNHAGSTSRRK